MGHRTKIPMLVAVLAIALAACGKTEAPVETTRPVLVVQPSGGAHSAFSAYAGEIRAREESALSFRVGGSLVKRLVDVGVVVEARDEDAFEDALGHALREACPKVFDLVH